MSLNMLASVAGMIDATSDLDFAAYSDPVLQEEFQSILDNTKALNEPISAPPQFKPVEHWDPHYDDFRHARWPYLDAFQDESIHRHFKNDVTMECATINCRGLDRFMYPIPNEMGICTILKEDFFAINNWPVGRDPELCPFQACNNATLIEKNYTYYGYPAPFVCLCPDNPFDSCYCHLDRPASYHDDGEYRCDTCFLKKTCYCNGYNAYDDAYRKEDGTFGYTRSVCRNCKPYIWGDVDQEEYEHWVGTCDCFIQGRHLVMGEEPEFGASCRVAINLWKGYGPFWDLYDITPEEFDFPPYIPYTCTCNYFVVPLMEDSNSVCSHCRQVRYCFCKAFKDRFGIYFNIHCQFCEPSLYYHTPDYNDDDSDDSDDSNDGPDDSNSDSDDTDDDDNDSGYHSSFSDHSDDTLSTQDTDDYFYNSTTNELIFDMEDVVYDTLNGTYTASIVRSPSPWSDNWYFNRPQYQKPRRHSSPPIHSPSPFQLSPKSFGEYLMIPRTPPAAPSPPSLVSCSDTSDSEEDELQNTLESPSDEMLVATGYTRVLDLETGEWKELVSHGTETSGGEHPVTEPTALRHSKRRSFSIMVPKPIKRVCRMKWMDYTEYYI